jgi:hypothetical protein
MKVQERADKRDINVRLGSVGGPMKELMLFLGALLITAQFGNASAQTIALRTCPTAGTATRNLHDKTAR